MNEPTQTQRSIWRSPLPWLALGFWLTYLFTASGGLEVSDAVLRYQTARSWLEGQGGALPRELGWGGGAVAPDGRVYSFYGPLQSVLMVPFLIVARALPVPGLPTDVVETFAISLGLFPLLSAGVIVLLYLALGHLGVAPRLRLLTCLGIGLGSMFWHYARMGQEESLVAFGFALWLLGAARLIAGRRFPALLMAAGAAVCLATRWSVGPQLAVLALATLILLWRFRERVSLRDLAAGVALVAGVAFLVLLYNHVRFGDWLQTGYGLRYAHEGHSMFYFDDFGRHLAALLVSPYRGLLFYSPIVLAGVAGFFFLRTPGGRLLGLTALCVLAVALLVIAAFRFWAGGHSWGPRFLTAPQVLLAPALAALFARAPRRAAWLVALLACLQIFSTMQPASTEEYVWDTLNRTDPGHCSEWRFECTAVPSRVPRALEALANTVENEPGMAMSGRGIVPPEVVLSTSDYRTLYWWPVRIAFRLRRFPAWVALLVCAAGLAAAAGCLARAWRRAATGETSLAL